MTKRKPSELLRGCGAHRRTESDYMGVLLDTVSLDDWRDVITGTLQLAKQGDPQARAWLAQYLVGKPEAKAPTPLTVVVQQMNGVDPLVDRLSRNLIYDTQFPEDGWKQQIKARVAAELATKLPAPETAEKPATAGDSGESAAVILMQRAK